MITKDGTFITAASEDENPSVKAFLCESLFQRLRGLLGREELLSEMLFWIRPCSSVHTCFMRVAIDLVYLDKRQNILKLVSGLRPWKFSGCVGASSVLELAEGQVDKLGLSIGDSFLCED